MTDLKLFQTNAGTMSELESSAAPLEKGLQTQFEKNLDTLLGVRFLASEYATTHGGRMDTLGIDENGYPVIIEYKRDRSENVINQGLFYLDWLMDHRGDFEILVRDRYGKEAAEAIEWSAPRLICIAADFTKYDEHAVKQMGRNIELVRYRKFGDDLLLLELLTAVSAATSTSTTMPARNGSRPRKDKTVSEYMQDMGPELAELFADADELDRRAGDRAHGKRCAAASVAVDPRQDDAGDGNARLELFGGVDCVLAGKRIDDEKGFDRPCESVNFRDFGHQLLVDGEPARRVEHDHIKAAETRRFHGASGDIDGRLARNDRQGSDAGLVAKDLELFLRGGAARVERGHEDALLFAFLDAHGELRRRRRLAGALKADHQDRRGRGHGEIESGVLGLSSQHLDQGVMNDLDHLLARRDRAQHLGADSPLLHLVNERLGDRKRDIGLEQRHAHFAQRFGDVLFLERPSSAELLENRPQTFAQAFKHAVPFRFPGRLPTRRRPRRRRPEKG